MVECDDKHCPKHANLSVRGSEMEGIVVSTKPKRTAIIEVHFVKFVPKYERYERRKSRISVHLPSCMDVKTGDKVKIAECRKISKTKAWVIIEKLGG
jgi:small subunit ribosomal protein S17